jgi:hypothetical protein
MIKPEFPYKGNQVIVTSERLVFHSRKDGIYLFGKATIGLSSVGTINMDSNEGIKINAPYIELGLNAQTLGESAVLGDTLTSILSNLNSALSLVANGLSKVDGSSEESVATSMSILSTVGDSLVSATNDFSNRLDGITSDTVYLV